MALVAVWPGIELMYAATGDTAGRNLAEYEPLFIPTEDLLVQKLFGTGRPRKYVWVGGLRDEPIAFIAIAVGIDPICC